MLIINFQIEALLLCSADLMLLCLVFMSLAATTFDYLQPLLPMTNDSTTSSAKADVKSNIIKSPRQSSLMYVRQFARVYMSFGNSDYSMFIVN